MSVHFLLLLLSPSPRQRCRRRLAVARLKGSTGKAGLLGLSWGQRRERPLVSVLERHHHRRAVLVLLGLAIGASCRDWGGAGGPAGPNGRDGRKRRSRVRVALHPALLLHRGRCGGKVLNVGSGGRHPPPRGRLAAGEGRKEGGGWGTRFPRAFRRSVLGGRGGSLVDGRQRGFVPGRRRACLVVGYHHGVVAVVWRRSFLE